MINYFKDISGIVSWNFSTKFQTILCYRSCPFFHFDVQIAMREELKFILKANVLYQAFICSLYKL